MEDKFTDNDARALLKLLHKYVVEYEPDLPVQVEHLASDLCQSLDKTSNEDDEMYQFIARAYHWDRVATAPEDKNTGWPKPANLISADSEDRSVKGRTLDVDAS